MSDRREVKIEVTVVEVQKPRDETNTFQHDVENVMNIVDQQVKRCFPDMEAQKTKISEATNENGKKCVVYEVSGTSKCEKKNYTSFNRGIRSPYNRLILSQSGGDIKIIPYAE